MSAAEIWIVEIKSSLEDLRADQKWLDTMHCDRLFFPSPGFAVRDRRPIPGVFREINTRRAYAVQSAGTACRRPANR
jgi:hypothetical protein